MPRPDHADASTDRGPTDAPAADSTHDVTRLLQELQGGDATVRDELARAVYQHLHAIAARHMRSEPSGHTLQTTVLVHEAFMRLVEQRGTSWRDRTQFYRLAARVMRRVLLDHARRRRAGKRDGGVAVALDAVQLAALTQDDAPDALVALEDALAKLAIHDPRAAQVVDLRWFGGLALEEVAAALDMSLSTAKRDWRFAQAFLRRALGEQGSAIDGVAGAAGVP